MSLTSHKIIPFSNYKREQTPKSQIYLHHTAGGPSGEQVYQYWESDLTPVATCVVISRDGTIVQGFNSGFWAYHLGLKNKHFAEMGVPYKNLDKTSIGVEICSYGWAKYEGGIFKNYVGGKIDKADIVELDIPYRGHQFWQGYSEAQIQSVCELLELWKQRYGIDIKYLPEQMWEVNQKALQGHNGLYTHNSVRPDKADIFPDPNLIKELERL